MPLISSKFNALDRAAWIATACNSYRTPISRVSDQPFPFADLLTMAGFMLIVGQILTLVPAKHVYVISLCAFALGSLVAAVAKSFNVVVLGRAIAGCGGGGQVFLLASWRFLILSPSVSLMPPWLSLQRSEFIDCCKIVLTND